MKTKRGSIAMQIYLAARPATMEEAKSGDTALDWEYVHGDVVYEPHGYSRAYIGEDKVWVGECTAAITLPDQVDLHNLMLNQLLDEKKELMVKYEINMQKIDKKIKEMQSLEHKPHLVAAD